jgi:prepilin-type N-terminal cleavage/methylation domain-containing protein
MRLNDSINRQPLSSSTAGFTLLETITVVSIIGILSGIAAPNWLNFINRQRLNTGQSQVYQAMLQARSQAMLQKVTWQVSFRQAAVGSQQVVQWSVHQANIIPAPNSWHNLDGNIRLDDETTLPNSKGVRRVRFNYYGCPVYQINDECGQTSILSKGRLTLSAQKGGKTKRCVIVSTLLGALRTAKENPKKQDGKYCY